MLSPITSKIQLEVFTNNPHDIWRIKSALSLHRKCLETYNQNKDTDAGKIFHCVTHENAVLVPRKEYDK
jgi:hypothetical protein